MGTWDTPPTPDEMARAGTGTSAAPVPEDRDSGLSLSDLVAGRTRPRASGLESLGRGALQGGSLGYADEMQGAAEALGIDAASLARAIVLGATAGPAGVMAEISRTMGGSLGAKGIDKTVEDYRAARDDVRAANEQAQADNPKTYLGGQIGGGLATALVPGAAPTTIGRALGVGAAYGAGAALGDSSADLTRGDVGGAAMDTAQGAGIGLVAGGLGHGAVRGAGALVNKLRGAKGSARTVAADVASRADEPSMLGTNKTIAQAQREGAGMELDVSTEIGEDFRLFPDQATGDPATALTRQRVSQDPRYMSKIQAQEGKQLDQATRYLDAKVDWIARKPEQLGQASDRLVKDIQRATEARIKARSAAAKPYYDKYRELAGDAPLAVDNAISTLETEIAQIGEGAGSEAASVLKKSLAALKTKPTLQTLESEMSYWSGASASKGTALEQLGSANRRRIARGVRDAIEADLDEATKAGSGEAVEALREGRRVWREHSQGIEEMGTATIRKILKAGATDSADTLADKMTRLSPQQVGGVFRVLDETAPETAQIVRARMLEDVLTSAGKPMRGASVAAQEGVAKLHPQTALKRLAKLEPTLRSAYAGDARSQAAYRDTIRLLQRLSFGPGLKGSQTMPLLADVAREGAEQAAVSAVGGPHIGLLAGMVRKIAGSDRAMAKTLSTAEGVEAFHRAARAMFDTRRGKTPPAKTVRAIIASMSRLGIEATEEAPRTGQVFASAQRPTTEVP